MPLSEIISSQLLEALPDGLLVEDANGRILFANRRAATLFGYSSGELVGRPFDTLIREESRAVLHGHKTHCMEQVEMGDDDPIAGLLGRHRDGSELRIDIRFGLLESCDGPLLTSSIRSIRDGGAAGEALRARERQQAAVAELGQLGLSCTDLQELLDTTVVTLGSVLDVEYCKVLEVRPGSVDLVLRAGVGWRPGLVRHAIVGSEHHSQAGYTLATDKPVIVEDLRTESRFSGPELLLEHQVVSGLSCVIVGPEGSPWGVLGVHTRVRRIFTNDDVNFLAATANILAAVIERHYFTQALHEREADLNRAQSVGRIGSWRLDLRRNKLTWSAETHRIFGIPEGTEMTYETFLATVHPDDRDYVEQSWQQALRGEPYDIEHRLAVDGPMQWVREKAELEFDKNGEILGGFGTAQDITERKETEAALYKAKEVAEQADSAKSRFLAAASHDLRQPLQTMSLLKAALDRSVQDQSSHKIVRSMGDALCTMEDLLNALLDINQLEGGTISPEFAVFPVSRLLKRLRSECRKCADEKGLESRFVPSRVQIRSDAALLERVLHNLVFNAIRYTESGKILVGCRRRGSKLRIEVWDTGMGIPEDELTSIFEEFYQVGNPARDRSKGLGLGLAIVNRIASLLGHHIDVRSTPGKGSMFAVEVPISSAAPDQPQAQESAHTADAIDTEGVSILLVEDDSAVLESTQMLLELVGHRITSAATVHEALERVEANRHNLELIITDYTLGRNETGIQLVERIRESMGHSLPAVIITGDTTPELQRKAGQCECQLLHKPVKGEQLLNCVHKLLDTCKLV